MAYKLRTKKKNGGGIAKVVERLQRSLFIGRNNNDDDENDNDNNNVEEFVNEVPEDVKEGHFAVVAVESEESKRFVVALTYLAHPRFKKLLERAAEEFGFDQEGALTIPCRPQEIERILVDNQWRVHNSWDSTNSMLQLC